MENFRAPRHLLRAAGSIVALAAGLASCGDDDLVILCLGPGCEGYDGGASKDSLIGDGSGGDGPGRDLDAGTGASCELEFLTPANGGDAVVALDPNDDIDGEACGSSFVAQVLLASNAARVNLFVNDQPLGEVAVEAGLARFEAELGNRSRMPNTLRAEATMPDGGHCSRELEPKVLVGCTGPSCSIGSPRPTRQGYLNQSNDSDGSAAGLQTTIVVITEAENAGQTVTLSIDGESEAVPTAVVEAGTEGRATFPDLTLDEGRHTVRARCSDAQGTRTRSAPSAWHVDVGACSLEIESVAGGADPITAADDLDQDAADGLEVLVLGRAEGDECHVLQIGECDGELADISLRDRLGEGGSFSVPIQLPSVTANMTLCARVEDAAGNVSTPDERIDVDVFVQAAGETPVVSFQSPNPGATFNLDTGCDVTAVVSCSANGEPVELFADGVSQGIESCLGNAASFIVPLPSKNDGQSTVLSAVQTALGLASEPASVSVKADCEAPVLTFEAPLCNTLLALDGDDVDPGTAGLQFDVNVANGGVPEVILTVLAAGNTDLEAIGDDANTEFAGVDLGDPGTVSLLACATDPQGNEGCTSSCALTVAAEAGITITDPRPPAVFTMVDDCDPSALGLQITVEGTSDATNGSPVEVGVGTGTPSTVLLASGAFSACVQAPEGDDQTLTATVTDTLSGLSTSDSVIVSINTSPPPAIAAPTFAVTGRRQGALELSWFSVLDGSGDPLVAYHLRCSRADITTEAIWDAATVLPVNITPASSAGIAETASVSNFRTGSERFCMVRGQDAYGQLTALADATPTVATVSNPFLTLDYTSITPTTLDGGRISVAALGDINGDGSADFAYGTQSAGVQVFFGGPALDADPDVSITLPSATQTEHEFGANVSGLGDINGDGLPDFAVTARRLTQITPALTAGGSVFVFFGRSSASPWPAAIAVAANPGCGADICFHSNEALAALGSSVTSTNFDAAQTTDLIIGSQNRALGATERVGRVYVILGGAQLAVASGTIFELPATTLSGFTIDPTTSTRNFGVNVSGIGTGGDGLGDLVVSAVGRAADGAGGEAFFIPGQVYPSGASGLVAYSPVPLAFASGAANVFGLAARAVGDVNGDALGDVWVTADLGASGVNPVFLGRNAGYSGVSLFGYTNDVVDNDWGYYVASGFHTELGRLGDLDNNGFDDVLIGSRANNGAPGTADLFYSDAATQNRVRSAADMVIDSSGNGQMTPGFVGDISGDGFRDVAILDSGPAPVVTRLTLLY
jgi:hypothetical protein